MGGRERRTSKAKSMVARFSEVERALRTADEKEMYKGVVSVNEEKGRTRRRAKERRSERTLTLVLVVKSSSNGSSKKGGHGLERPGFRDEIENLLTNKKR